MRIPAKSKSEFFFCTDVFENISNDTSFFLLYVRSILLLKNCKFLEISKYFFVVLTFLKVTIKNDMGNDSFIKINSVK